MERRYQDFRDIATGLVFRFLHDLGDPSQLHVQARWNVSPAEAIEAFISGTERTIWLEQKRCFETVAADHVVVWLWIDERQNLALVITCVPRSQSHYA